MNTTYYVAFMQLSDIKSSIHVESVSLSDEYATFHVAFWLTSDIKGGIHVTKRDTREYYFLCRFSARKRHERYYSRRY